MQQLVLWVELAASEGHRVYTNFRHHQHLVHPEAQVVDLAEGIT
jgi:hypothetical protein